MFARTNPKCFANKISSIISKSNSTYTKPRIGVNPAYDEALKVIESFRSSKLNQIQEIEAQIKKEESLEKTNLLSNQKTELEVLADRYLGETKWNVRNDNYDLTKPVYRKILQEEFRKRPLEVIMQRSHQMFVIPDVIDPSLFPSASAQLNLTFDAVQSDPIAPGIRIEPQDAKELPKIQLMSFSEKPQLYTIVMVDPDVPNETEQTYTQTCHWATCNVPFDIYNQQFSPETMGDKALDYLPPHPPFGSKVHRYIFVALKQGENGDQKLSKEDFSRDFNLREFTLKHGLVPAGVSFFRSEWNATVDEFYQNVLGQKPPRYGEPLSYNPNIGRDGQRLRRYENM
ncbi:hypothetical protein BB559_004240 [Furculomyces boomerangus]|uniref:Phosphatidylethanolamine-binding protein n=2 Tax=Harpellales TaxID=61421 RepID=A0A2T9Y916_9FUNG|nr:hypothetical protein BB559_005370 [Furculomyces boomerangus]PVU91254.1 hypothetical protein BB559_004240 [Furculomyces boomerangus]PWA01931.1 hypothetical protein BB558_001962 [Smittium angustum]